MTRAAAAALTAAVIGGVSSVAPALADPAPNWDGWYRITFHTDQKSGTSMAATQTEEPYTAAYLFATDCTTGTCVASVLKGPAPKDNVTQSVAFNWTGSQWSWTNNWRWDCLLPDGTVTFEPASSVTTYSPQADGSLTGTFATNIGGGDCQGTVYIPLTAAPFDPDSVA